ncbi:MAG: penicillin-binding protein 2 [Chloroflexi bacterium]|nr:penicillin-binding protein 2 [Chloroflexota bacterium]
MLDSDEPRGRTSGVAPHLFRVAVLVAFALLAAQLWRLQIVEGAQLRQRADSNRVRVSPISPPRGVIYDRKGTLVAANAPIFVVSVVPSDIKPVQEAVVYGRLSQLLDVSVQEIRQAVEKRKAEGFSFTPVPIKSNVPREAALLLEQEQSGLPGVRVTVESARKYSEGKIMAHLLGYTGPISPAVLSPAEYKQKIEKEGYTINDKIGAAGLEDTYESILRGKPGRRMYEVEASGREVGTLREEPAEPGKNLVMTIDLDLQRAVTQFMSEGLFHGSVGVAVVSDAKSGEILSLVSLPAYDDNVFGDDTREAELSALLKDPEQPFFHRAVAGNYPPGSTFKLVTGLAGLQEGVFSKNTVIESKGILWVPHDFYPGYRQPFPDHSVLGKLDYARAIAMSSNIYFFYVGGGYEPEGFVGLGNERLARYARMIGFGSPTGIDLPGETSGTVPDEAWKQQKVGERWVKGDTYNMSIGQGYVESSPLQVHGMTTMIANQGKLLRPRVVRQIVDSDGNVEKTAKPEVVRSVEVDQRFIQATIDGMELGFASGLLKDYRIPGLRIAGKTGTAEYGQATNPQGELPTHGWFTGFAPVEDPKVVVTVFVERGSSSRDAAPIAMRIIRHIFGFPDVPPKPPTPTPQTPPGPGASPAPAPARPQVGVPVGPSGQGAPGSAPQPAPAPAAAPAPAQTAPAAPSAPGGPTQPARQPAAAPTAAPRAPAAAPAPTAAPRGAPPAAPPPAAPAPNNGGSSGPGLFNPSFPASAPKPRN